MGVSDVAAGNITTLFLAVIIAVRSYGFITGQPFGGFFAVVVSSAVVGLIFVAALAWDVARKATKIVTCGQEADSCKGGICWHGVAVRSPAAQVRFGLPQNL